MSVKVAINGFGRIGRLAFRQMFGAEGYEVVAINDLTSPKMLAHLLKYDSTQGNYAAIMRFHASRPARTSSPSTARRSPSTPRRTLPSCPWGKLGVDVVLECTGFYTSKDKAQAHIDAGAKKVVISAPAGNDLPTIVYNVNHKTLTQEDNIISAASCTTNCLAPMAKALNDGWPDPVRHYVHHPRLHRRPDDSGRPAAQGRPASFPCRCCEHRSQLHRRCQGHRSGHPRAERQADRRCSACSHPHRLHHHPERRC